MTVEYGIECIGNIFENFIFAYVGISVPILLENVKFSLVLLGCIALVISRAISVFSVSLLVNSCKKVPIPFSHQIVMTYGGLRGAVAFYLALQVHNEYSSLILTTTISIILFTVVLLGSTTTPLLIFLNKMFPEDEIFCLEQPLADHQDGNDDDDPMNQRAERMSIGMITKIEQWDMNIAQKFLRKDGWIDVLHDEFDPNNEEYILDQENIIQGKFNEWSPQKRAKNLTDQINSPDVPKVK